MKALLRNIAYSPLWATLHLVALMPLRLLYGVSDVLYLIVYYVVRYRRRLVRANLQASFPDKTDEERLAIERRFYRNFTDVFVETIKLLHISDDEVRRRVVFEGTERVDRYVDKGKSVAIYAAHFCNWEWLSSITLWLKDSEGLCSQVYRPLRNQWFDEFYYRLRKRFHSESIAKKEVLRTLLRIRRSGRCFVTGFISDQKPSHNDGHHHVEFLHQQTPFITGTEMLLRKMGTAVMYFDIRRIRRGYYKVVLRPMFDDASKCAEYEITDAYACVLEQAIREQPDAWLWTHNRWRRRLN